MNWILSYADGMNSRTVHTVTLAEAVYLILKLINEDGIYPHIITIKKYDD